MPDKEDRQKEEQKCEVSAAEKAIAKLKQSTARNVSRRKALEDVVDAPQTKISRPSQAKIDTLWYVYFYNSDMYYLKEQMQLQKCLRFSSVMAHLIFMVNSVYGH